MELSINQLAELTGKDRRTIASRLEVMDFVPGPKQAHLYESRAALALIYGSDGAGKSLEQARTELALEQAAMSRVKREEAEKSRPPLELVLALLSEINQATAATLKAHRGKKLTAAACDELLAKFRELPGRLKW